MIAEFGTDHNVEDVVNELVSSGVVLLKGCAPIDLLGSAERRLTPLLEGEVPSGGRTFGYRTRRFTGFIPTCPPTWELLTDGRALSVVGRYLTGGVRPFQLGTAVVMQVLPGGENQPLHRDRSLYASYLPFVSEDVVCSVMWPVSTFTTENGATRFVVDDKEVVCVADVGDAIVWTGTVEHALGSNRSSSPRTGVLFTYSAGWLRPEENFYVTCPPDQARMLPLNVRQLLGYREFGLHLGYVQKRNPLDLLELVAESVSDGEADNYRDRLESSSRDRAASKAMPEFQVPIACIICQLIVQDDMFVSEDGNSAICGTCADEISELRRRCARHE